MLEPDYVMVNDSDGPLMNTSVDNIDLIQCEEVIEIVTDNGDHNDEMQLDGNEASHADYGDAKELVVKELLGYIDNDKSGVSYDDDYDHQSIDGLLEKFLANDGWMKCFHWLESVKQRKRLKSSDNDEDNPDDVDDNDDNNNNNNNNNEFTIDLLKLYKKLPVTVNMLKQNSCAKLIKRMIKSKNEEISSLSKDIIDDWMSKVSANKQKDESKIDANNRNNSVKKKKKKDKEDNNNNNNNNHNNNNNNNNNNHNNNNNNNHNSNNKLNSNVNKIGTVNCVEKSNSSHRRHSSSSTDSLLESSSSTASSLSSLSLSTSTTSPSSSVKMSDKASTLKMAKTIVVSEPATTTTSCFMSALTSSVNSAPERRKRSKLTNRKREAINSSGSGSNNGTSSTSNRGDVETNNTNNNNSIDDNDVDNDVDDNDDKTDSEDNDISDPNNTTTTVAVTSSVTMTTTIGTGVTTHSRRRSTSTSSSSAMSGEPVVKRRRKMVRWADDASLCTYFFFQMDETERVNVNRGVDFAETWRHEIEMEHRMFQNARKMFSDDNVTVKMPWHRPSYLSDAISLVEPGCNSLERKVQMIREQNVLQVIYFSRCMIPDQPAEADAEFLDINEPKIIPLHDVTSQNNEVLYEHANASTTAASQQQQPSNQQKAATIAGPAVDPAVAAATNPAVDANTLAALGPTAGGMPLPWGPMYHIPNVLTDGQGLVMPPPRMMPPMMYPPPPGFPPFPPPIPMMAPEFMRGVMPPMMQFPGFFHKMSHHYHTAPSRAQSLPQTKTIHISPGSAKPLCTHYLAGTCKFGANCRNFHPPPINQPPINQQLPPTNHQTASISQSPTKLTPGSQSPGTKQPNHPIPSVVPLSNNNKNDNDNSSHSPKS